MKTKIDINKMELPEWDVIKSRPILIPLKKGNELIFEIPSTEAYFDFESLYVKLLAKHFFLFSKVNFLDYKEFADMSLKKQMIKEVYKVIQLDKAKKDFIKIIDKYFQANFKIKKVLKIVDPMELAYLFLFIHKVIETVKKKFLQVLEKMDVQIQAELEKDNSFIFSNTNSEKVVPRF